MVVGLSEYFLKRKLRSVLDIGAGEGAWRSELRRINPEIRYQGVDPSEYVVRRYGKRRNIKLGGFEELPDLALGTGYDLVVCADVIQYVPTAVLQRGVRHISKIMTGVAFLESYTSGDDMEGDLTNWHHRTKLEYRRLYARAGLVACGLHCYLKPAVATGAVELELL